MEVHDVYVFIENANKSTIEEFLSKFLCDCTAADSEFEYPRYGAETLYETDSFEEMLNFVIKGNFKEYTFYLECLSWKMGKGGIIKTYEDNSVCLALSVFPEFIDKYEQELGLFYGDQTTFVLYYLPPPSNSNERTEN